MLEISLGTIQNFELEQIESVYALETLKVFFSNELASYYQPIIYGDTDDPNVQPEGIYYRIVQNFSNQEYCLQYCVYWLKQNCSGFVGIGNHIYDYEPILVFVDFPDPMPVGIVNSGWSKVLGFNHCRFHKTEIRRMEYNAPDPQEFPQSFNTSSSPSYPFGGKKGISGTNCIKRYPIGGAIYFEKCKPLFGLATCFHAFSGAADALKGTRLQIPLKKLEDNILAAWFMNHHNRPDEEPFGHDVSNPFDFPYIKYVDPKPFLTL